MRITQIAISGENDSDYAKLIALTDDGKLFGLTLSPNVFKGEEENWRRIMLPTEIRTEKH